MKNKRITTLEEHQALLRHVFDTAKSRVTVVSPFISDTAIMHDNIAGTAAQAVSRGVAVDVFIDDALNRDPDGQLKKTAHDGIASMLRSGAQVTVLSGIHHKTLIRDNDLITDGSFNWLSAVRQKGGSAQREERTVVITGDHATEMIAAEDTFVRENKNAYTCRLKEEEQEAPPAVAQPVPQPVEQQPAPRPPAAQKKIKMYNRFYHKKPFQIGVYLSTALALPFLPDVGDALVLLVAVVFWFLTTKPKMHIYETQPLTEYEEAARAATPMDGGEKDDDDDDESYPVGSVNADYFNMNSPFFSDHF